jgi:hypothetical protein
MIFGNNSAHLISSENMYSFYYLQGFQIQKNELYIININPKISFGNITKYTSIFSSSTFIYF